MKSSVFRTYHLLEILKGYERQEAPLDLFLSDYCRQHKALGSTDRKIIVETVYGLVRWRGLLDFVIEGSPTWEKRVTCYSDFDPKAYRERSDIPAHIRVSFPKNLFELLVCDYGEEGAMRLALASNTAAPTTARANTLKTTREQLLVQLATHCEVTPCKLAPNGFIFSKRLNFLVLPEFRNGLFEVQDEGSQLVAALVKAEPGDIVMDFCAGSGGKSLAIAAEMKNKGQLYLHDVRKNALDEARKRLRRAGIQNAQVMIDGDPKLAKLKKNCDWVLVDAPCSGTGTLRRNPDMKWRFDPEWVKKIEGLQRLIFERALSYLKPQGRIVYATCSLLKNENEQQTDHFVKTYDLEVVGEEFVSHPTEGGMDGFYGVVLQRKEHWSPQPPASPISESNKLDSMD